MHKRIIVAIDGPAGAGKSTVARAVAVRLGFVYIDTGAMYRALAWQALQDNVPLGDHTALEEIAAVSDIDLQPGSGRIAINRRDVTDEIRTPEVSEAASRISVISGVRAAMVFKQRQLADTQSVVMEGRDIGTVVFPHATVKIYLDADANVRAERRIQEMQRKRVPVSASQVTADMLERDARDRSRAQSPLLQAPDAIYIDSTGLSAHEVEEAILKVVRERTANGKEVVR